MAGSRSTIGQLLSVLAFSGCVHNRWIEDRLVEAPPRAGKAAETDVAASRVPVPLAAAPAVERIIDDPEDIMLLERQGATTQVAWGGLRVELDGEGARVGEGRFASGIVYAVRHGERWIFLARDGSAAASDGFLGPLQALSEVPFEVWRPRDLTLRRSCGRLAVVDSKGDLWSTDGTAPLQRHTGTPLGLAQIAFLDATHGLAIDRAGQLYETHDGGDTFAHEAAGPAIRVDCEEGGLEVAFDAWRPDAARHPYVPGAWSMDASGFEPRPPLVPLTEGEVDLVQGAVHAAHPLLTQPLREVLDGPEGHRLTPATRGLSPGWDPTAPVRCRHARFPGDRRGPGLVCTQGDTKLAVVVVFPFSPVQLHPDTLEPLPLETHPNLDQVERRARRRGLARLRRAHMWRNTSRSGDGRTFLGLTEDTDPSKLVMWTGDAFFDAPLPEGHGNVGFADSAHGVMTAGLQTYGTSDGGLSWTLLPFYDFLSAGTDPAHCGETRCRVGDLLFDYEGGDPSVVRATGPSSLDVLPSGSVGWLHCAAPPIGSVKPQPVAFGTVHGGGAHLDLQPSVLAWRGVDTEGAYEARVDGGPWPEEVLAATRYGVVLRKPVRKGFSGAIYSKDVVVGIPGHQPWRAPYDFRLTDVLVLEEEAVAILDGGGAIGAFLLVTPSGTLSWPVPSLQRPRIARVGDTVGLAHGHYYLALASWDGARWQAVEEARLEDPSLPDLDHPVRVCAASLPAEVAWPHPVPAVVHSAEKAQRVHLAREGGAWCITGVEAQSSAYDEDFWTGGDTLALVPDGSGGLMGARDVVGREGLFRMPVRCEVVASTD